MQMVDRAERFDRLYRADIDPWGFRTTEYERQKYAATLAAMPRPHYEVAIEAGCSIGELTRKLAPRCDRIIGIDVSEVALKEARTRHQDLPHLSFLRGELPADWPAMEADLVILSEVLYFLTLPEIDALAERIARHWKSQGHCILVNYLGRVPEKVQGEEAAARFIAAMGGALHRPSIVTEQYRIDVLENGENS